MPETEKAVTRKPQKPFYFNTSEHLLRIGRQKANTLNELLQAMQTCPDDSIFQHTFRTLQEHHAILEALEDRDPVLAREAMAAHLMHIRGVLTAADA